MSFLFQPLRQFEFTSPVFDYLKYRILTIKPISSLIFANPKLRLWLTRRRVNERILEIPFVLSKISGKKRILDVGACESPLSLMLASLGHRVTALDLRPYPFTHPNLESQVGDITRVKLEKFDIIICLSVLEHIGLDVYGGVRETGKDQLAIKSIFRLLFPNGKLLLTTPMAKTLRQHDSWREYDLITLNKYLKQFSKVSILTGVKNSLEQWVISPELPSGSDFPTAVALIEAFK